MSARIQYASGSQVCCDPVISSIAGNLSAGTYYFWLQARNDIGYNLPSSSVVANVSNNTGIRVTIPTALAVPGSNWWQVGISINTVDDPSTATLLLNVDVRNGSQEYLTFPIDIDLIEDAQLVLEESVSSFPSINLVNGLIKTYVPNGNNYRYVAGSTATVDGVEVFSSPSGRWHRFYDPYNIYLDDIEDGCDKPLQLVSDSDHILNIDYAADGSAGSYREYWIFNKATTPISIGKRIGLTVNNAGEDVTSSYVALLQTIFTGYFDQANNQLITTYNDVDNFTYLDTVEAFSLNQNNFTLERDIEENQAFSFRVYPEFDISEISASDIVPAYNSEITLIPFIYANQGIPTDLGSFLGNSILGGNGGFRRVYPSLGLTAFVDSGSGIIENYFWKDIPATSVLNLAINEANQILAVNTNGNVYRVDSLSGNEDQRALVSTVAGESEISPYSTEFEGDENPSITTTVTYPSFIRTSYPDIIAGSDKGSFNAEEIVFYVKKKTSSGGAIVETRKIEGFIPAEEASEEFSFLYEDGLIVANDSEPDSSFGLYAPATPTVDLVTLTTGGFYFELSVSFKYNGNTITNVSHAAGDGCVGEVVSTFAELTSLADFYKIASSNITVLANTSQNELNHKALYPVLADEAGSPQIYVYLADNLDVPDGANIVGAVNGPGNFIKFTGKNGTSGFNLKYLFNSSTFGDPTSGKLLFNNATLSSVTNFSISKTDRLLNNVGSVLATITAGSFLQVNSINDPDNYAMLKIVSVSDLSTYFRFTVSHEASNGNFTDNEQVAFTFTIKGEQGVSALSSGTHTTASLADQAIEDFAFTTIGSQGVLREITLNRGGWVILYVDAASRTNDLVRVQNNVADPVSADTPLPGSGVIVEIYLTSAGTQIISDRGGRLYYNNDTPLAETIYARYANTTGATGVTQIDIDVLRLN